MKSNVDYSQKETPAISWSTLKSLIPYLMEFKQRIVIALVCLIGAKLASVSLPFLLKYIVDDLDSGIGQLLVVPLGLLIAYGAVRFANVLFAELRDTIFGRVTERAMRRLGLEVFQHLHRLDLEFHLDRNTGGLSRDIERGVSGISFLMRFIVFSIVPTFLEIGMVILILFAKYDVWFALITLVAIVVYVLFSIVATEWRTRFVRAANLADSESNTRAVDSLMNYETVKYFGNERFEAEQYDTALADWELARRQNRLSLFALNGGQALIVSVAMAAMLILAAANVTRGEMTLGDFVLVNAFMMQLFMPLNFLGFIYREMKGSLANIERMFILMQRPPKIEDQPSATSLIVSQGEVEFKQVDFSYNAERPILRNISVTIKPRQKVAVVGPSGAGKSTLVKLLYRFYEVDAGEILIDGQIISRVTQDSLRRAIGIVPQDTVLFNTSIKENIRYGRIEATDNEVNEAARLANLQNFIAQLPHGMETIVGERGLKVSGGEKQRIAIARTILKRPPIMVFDEATSSLDSQTEKAILQSLKSVAKGHTSLVIAHRLSTVVDADLIIVLDQGRIAEMGDHNALLGRNGVYTRLWKAQQKHEL